MASFTTADGRTLRTVEGFRREVLEAFPSKTPTAAWSQDNYARLARRRVRNAESRVRRIARHRGSVGGADVLDVGCGMGIETVVTGLKPVRSVVGIDLAITLLEGGEQGDRARRLGQDVLADLGLHDDLEDVLRQRPIRFAVMDAAALDFADASFDVLCTDASLEHLRPLPAALAEMARVVRPGGLLVHAIDPYFWLKGCHRRGVLDLPWAHARLSPEDLWRFVKEREGRARAIRTSRWLASLNQLSLDGWWRAFEAADAFDVLEWRETRSSIAEAMLAQHPDVLSSLRPGIESRDLVCSTLHAVLRRR
jgi:SAM-dependent methyltransferase